MTNGLGFISNIISFILPQRGHISNVSEDEIQINISVVAVNKHLRAIYRYIQNYTTRDDDDNFGHEINNTSSGFMHGIDFFRSKYNLLELQNIDCFLREYFPIYGGFDYGIREAVKIRIACYIDEEAGSMDVPNMQELIDEILSDPSDSNDLEAGSANHVGDVIIEI